MNLCLINLIGKWIGILSVTLVSFFGGYSEKEIKTTNNNKQMNLNLSTEIIPYQTEIRYNNTKKAGEQTVLVEGSNGYLVVNGDNNTTKVVKNAVNRVIEVGTYVDPSSSFNGKLTVYYDCPNSSTCRTSSGHNLKQSVYYNDPTYGLVRVLSAAQSKFKEGTIVEISNTKFGNIMGIVLDTGGDMIASMNRGKVWMDLAIDYSEEPHLRGYSTNNAVFTVKRWGY